MADANYPDGLLYHPEHDWARIDGDVATFGITWYAQDSLGEVLYFDTPGVGTQVTADEPYGEGWLIRVRLDDVASHGELLDVEAYKALLPE